VSAGIDIINRLRTEGYAVESTTVEYAVAGCVTVRMGKGELSRAFSAEYEWRWDSDDHTMFQAEIPLSLFAPGEVEAL
jgi:hypothetical protein